MGTRSAGEKAEESRLDRLSVSKLWVRGTQAASSRTARAAKSEAISMAMKPNGMVVETKRLSMKEFPRLSVNILTMLRA